MGATLHEKRCIDVLHASSVADFKKQIVEFALNLGFETVGALVVRRHSPTLVEFQTLTNAPEAYLDEFYNQEHCAMDPVTEHCSQLSTPVVWNRQTYAAKGVEALWEIQAPFGYKSGIAFAMHLDRGTHFMFGANWSADRCEKVRNFRTIAEDLLSFGAHAQAAAFELTLPSRQAPGGAFSLAKVELEALRWSMDGMTSWQVSDRMSISERHATLLTRRAMQKLDCSTKYEAVLRAIKLGLIEAV